MISHKLAATLSATALMSGAVIAAGGLPAHAATTPNLPLAASSCGTGSSVTWTASQQPVLTVGTAPAATCGAPAGSTYNPAYAKVAFSKVAGSVVPQSEPKFTTDNYASGSPRMVIDLNNGHSLWGYPSNSGLNGPDMAWAVDNGNTYTSYQTAYTKALAYETTVKDAYIVEDADQVPGTSDTLSNIQFGGATPQTTTIGPGYIKNFHSGKCLDVTAGNYTAGGRLQQWTCGAIGRGVPGGDQKFTLITFPGGQSELEANSSNGTQEFFVTSSGQGMQLALSQTPQDLIKSGPYYEFAPSGPTTTREVMDVKGQSTANGALVIGWPLNKGTNQQWSLP